MNLKELSQSTINLAPITIEYDMGRFSVESSVNYEKKNNTMNTMNTINKYNSSPNDFTKNNPYDPFNNNPFSTQSTRVHNRRSRKRKKLNNKEGNLFESLNKEITESSESDDEKIDCNNPLCDHKKFTEDDIVKGVPPPESVNITNIDDLIKIGKLYHCQKLRTYYGINLRLLCNLVEPLTELQSLVGMKNVKVNIINQIVFFLQGFNTIEKCNNCKDCAFNLPCTQNGTQDMLHCAITGPPGVGKTRLGHIMGKIYKAMGVLSKGHMKIVSRSDLVGKYLGHTAAKTQKVIDECEGGVMFIDEAYSLGNKDGRDSFSKECLDTLNQNLTEKKDFLCIIAGYKKSLEECFFSYNEGLRRRFTFRYDIPGYTSAELMEIFKTMVKQKNWKLWVDVDENDNPEMIIQKTNDNTWLSKFFDKYMKYFKNYGGDMETLFLNCKIYHGKRVLFLDQSYKKTLSKVDIEEGLNTFIDHRKIKREGKRRNPYGMLV